MRLRLLLALFIGTACSYALPVTVAWDQSPETNLLRYSVYEVSQPIPAKVADTPYPMTRCLIDVPPGPHSYAVTAVGDYVTTDTIPLSHYELESPLSNIVYIDWTIPPQVPLQFRNGSVRVVFESSPDMQIWSDEFEFFHYGTEPRKYWRLETR